MQNKLFGVAAIIFSLSILLVSIGIFNLMGEYSRSFKRQADITEKSSYIIDSIATTVFLKLAERDKEISGKDSAAIKNELAERSKNGYLFERFLMAWDFPSKKKDKAEVKDSGSHTDEADGEKDHAIEQDETKKASLKTNDPTQ
jgi:hypothetical protein